MFRVIAAWGGVAALLQLGCARLVVLSPQEVAARNDAAWTVRARPSAAASPADAPAEAPTRASFGEAPPAATVVAPPIVAPLPFGRRPEVDRARASRPDSFGVPADLYAVDPLLAAHRKEMESQASSRHAVGGGTIVFGLVCAGIGVWATSVGTSNQGSSDQQSQATISGVTLIGLSIGAIIGGTILALTSSDPTPLQRYYRETYAQPR
jgi:hypothetical protein